MHPGRRTDADAGRDGTRRSTRSDVDAASPPGGGAPPAVSTWPGPAARVRGGDHGPRRSWLPHRRDLVVALLAALGYLVAGRYVVAVIEPVDLAAVFWPAAGISLAALLLTPRRAWPWILLAIGGVELTTNLVAGLQWWPSLWWTAANVAAPLLAAVLLQHLGWLGLRDVRSVLRFALVAGIAAPVVAGLIGTVGTVLAGSERAVVAHVLEWAIGDGLGVVTVTPLLLLLHDPRARRCLREPGVVVGVAAAVAVAVLVFQPWTATWDMALPYLLLPPMIWVALRHGLLPAAVTTFITAQIAFVTTALSRGPFAATSTDPSQVLLLLQLYLVVATLTCLLVAARSVESQDSHDRAALEQVRADREATLRALSHAALAADDSAALRRAVEDVLGPESTVAFQGLPSGDDAGHPPYRQADGRSPRSTPADDRLLAEQAQLIIDQARARLDIAQELERTNAQLRAALQARDRFLAVVSHELRTPLTPIVGFAEHLLVNGGLGTDERAGIEVIYRQGHHLTELIDQLLTLATLTDRGAQPAPQLVDARASVDRAVHDLALDTPTTVVDGGGVAWVDPDHLHRILTVLLANAQRFGAPPIAVSLSTVGDALRLVVDDHGPGVQPAFAPYLFDRFAQPDTGDRRTSQGLGIGLAVAKLLTEANGGTLTYTATVGAGARFAVTLPTQAATATAPGPGFVHDLLLHDGADAPARLASLLAPGLAAGLATVVIATEPQRDGVRRALAEAGHRDLLTIEDGRYIEVEATTLLDRILVGTSPDPQRFRQVWDELHARLGDRPVQLYGEMVAVCMDRGLPQAAIDLEALWNGLATQFHFDLYCGYPQQAFDDQPTSTLDTIRSQHRCTVPAVHQRRSPATTCGEAADAPDLAVR